MERVVRPTSLSDAASAERVRSLVEAREKDLARRFLEVAALFCLLMPFYDYTYVMPAVYEMSIPSYLGVAVLAIGVRLAERRRGFPIREAAVAIQVFAILAFGLFQMNFPRFGVPSENRAFTIVTLNAIGTVMCLVTPVSSWHGLLVLGLACLMHGLVLATANPPVLIIAMAPVLYLSAGYIKCVLNSMIRKEAEAIRSAELVAAQNEKLKLEQDLTWAKRIQDSCAMPALLEVGDLAIRTLAKKEGALGGDWVGHRVSGGWTYVLLIDAAGKGIQASLVVHAVQSLWMSTLDDPHFEPEAWLAAVNLTMVRMGKTESHAASAGLLGIASDRIVYWNCGHLPLFGTGAAGSSTVKAWGGSGNMLGLGTEFACKGVEVPGASEPFDLLLVSDGVFANARVGAKRTAEVLAQLKRGDVGMVEISGIEDDRTLVWISRGQAARRTA